METLLLPYEPAEVDKDLIRLSVGALLPQIPQTTQLTSTTIDSFSLRNASGVASRHRSCGPVDNAKPLLNAQASKRNASRQ